MKTINKIVICSLLITITTSISAQSRSRGNDPRPQNNHYQNQRYNNYNNGSYYAQGYNHPRNVIRGRVNINIGSYPYYNRNYYGYNRSYSVRTIARNSIRNSAQIINNALQYSDWNDTYSPVLAKAIRHQQYAKQLYFWGNYRAALNYAERAGYLAWNSLSYFNDSFGYDDGFAGTNYPNPYSDPNNPYYMKPATNNNETNNSMNSDQNTAVDVYVDDVYSYQKSNSNANSNSTIAKNNTITTSELESALPKNTLSDRELLKTSIKDLDVE